MADYTSLSAVKDYLGSTSSAHDTRLLRCVTRASRLIDAHCGRWFAPIRGTRQYGTTGSHITGRLLLLDADLLSVSKIAVGERQALDPDCTILRPINWPPYFGISLKQSSGLRWDRLGEPGRPISISGVWGYASSTPEPVEQAATRLAAWLYRQPEPEVPPGPAEGTTPMLSGLPPDISRLLGPFIRLRVSVYPART